MAMEEARLTQLKKVSRAKELQIEQHKKNKQCNSQQMQPTTQEFTQAATTN